MALNLDTLLIQVVINIIVMAPALWVSGRVLAGKDKAKFIDAIWIVVLGTVVSTIFNGLFDGIIASIILLVLLLGLVKHFFDCSWWKALAIAIFAVIIFVVVLVILGLIGIGIGLSLLLF